MQDYLPTRAVWVELLDSIRQYEARISEVLMMLNTSETHFIKERRIKSLERLSKLIETREKLLRSFLKVHKIMSKKEDTFNLFCRLDFQYEDLKHKVKNFLEEYEEYKNA